MTDFAKALKAEVARIARKEARAQAAAGRKLASQHRREIAALKRQLKAIEQRLRTLARSAARSAPASAPQDTPATKRRFSAKGLRAHRERLGLSAQQVGRLLGVSGQTVYNWERGKTAPRSEQMASVASLRTMGRRKALAALAQEA